LEFFTHMIALSRDRFIIRIRCLKNELVAFRFQLFQIVLCLWRTDFSNSRLEWNRCSTEHTLDLFSESLWWWIITEIAARFVKVFASCSSTLGMFRGILLIIRTHRFSINSPHLMLEHNLLSTKLHIFTLDGCIHRVRHIPIQWLMERAKYGCGKNKAKNQNVILNIVLLGSQFQLSI